LVSEYKYLGIWLDNRMNMDKHLEKLAEKINFRTSSIKGKIYELDTRLKVIIW